MAAEWQEQERHKLFLYPRGTFKTTVLTTSGAIFEIVNNPNIRILISNAGLENAKTILKGIKDHFIFNEKFRAMFPEFCPRIHHSQKTVELGTQMEFSVPGRKIGIKESTVEVGSVEGNLVSRHYDMHIGDDLVSDKNTTTREQIDKVDFFRQAVYSLLEPGTSSDCLIGCLTCDSRVLMADNTWRPIVDVEVGEKVWSFDKDRLVKKEVEAMIPQGRDDVFEIRTNRHSLRATGNHPFLTVQGGWCRGGTNNWSLKWLRADELKKNDFILTVKETPGPSRDSEFAWFFGFMMGDGWVTCHKRKNQNNTKSYAVCFAAGVDEALNEKVVAYMAKRFGGRIYKTDFGYYRMDCNKAGRFLMNKGLVGGAQGKRIPKWIYNMGGEAKRTFLIGLIDADGWKTSTGDGYRIELCNDDLVNDVWELCLTSGVRPTTIFKRVRSIKPPNSKLPVRSSTSSIGMVFETKPRFRRFFDNLESLHGVRIDRVKEIEECGDSEVFDLTIADTHNFIAEGFVVHNTRWHWDDIYGRIMEDKDTLYKIYHHAIYEPDENGVNKSIFPKRFTMDVIEEIRKKQSSSMFANQYLNMPIAAEDQKFKQEMIEYYDMPRNKADRLDFIKPLYVVTAIDPAVSERDTADYSTIVTIGVDHEEKTYVLEAKRGRWNPGQLIDEMFTTYMVWKPATMGVEVFAYQKSIIHFLREEMRRRKQPLPIEELATDTTRSKSARIEALIPRIEHLPFLVTRDMVDLVDELLRYPKAKHDDLVDALASTEQLRRIPSKAVVRDPNTGSRWIDAMNRIKQRGRESERIGGHRFKHV